MKLLNNNLLFSAIALASSSFSPVSARLRRQLDSDHTHNHTSEIDTDIDNDTDIHTHNETDTDTHTHNDTYTNTDTHTDTGTSSERSLTLRIINQTFKQPFSPFFVMVHNDQTSPLYARGQPASSALATLSEEGDSSELLSLYENTDGVWTAFQAGGLTLPGSSVEVHITVSDEYPLVTIASMAVNTNDCFVSLNGAALQSGMVLNTAGNDAGSEVNNEDCSCIPGPACADFEKHDGNCGAGEGYVHVHRGVHGFEGSDLLPQEVDWRNPMMRVVVV